jgi:CRP/FNR family transcriptional regulator, cyclic AMP receptor protein
MATSISTDTLKKINFFRGLDDTELGMVSALCKEKKYQVGEICQTEGQSDNHVHIIIKGRAGAVAHIPNIGCNASEIILDTLGPGEVFGWSALIRGTPWSTLRVLEPTEIILFNGEDLMNLCEKNSHIGYVMMKNLAMLIAARLRRNRMSTLNAIVAMKGI